MLAGQRKIHKTVVLRATYEQFDFCGIHLSNGNNDDFGRIIFTEKQNLQRHPQLHLRMHSLQFVGCLHRPVTEHTDSGSLQQHMYLSARPFFIPNFFFPPDNLQFQSCGRLLLPF